MRENNEQFDDYNPSAGFEELLAEEEEEFAASGERVSIRAGIAGNTQEEERRPAGQDPNAVRWLFNPFAMIDLTNKPASCGFPHLEHIRFNQVKTIVEKVRKTFVGDLPSHDPTNPQHSEADFKKTTRTAEMIALELANQHGDKGVVILEALTGRAADAAAHFNSAVFGEEIECVFDVNNEEHPVPVLPNLLEIVEENSRRAPEIRPLSNSIRDSLVRAIRYARARIDEAQKRLLDEKNPNRTLSPAEQRCYLALGEEIPNQMPFLTRTQAGKVNQFGGGIDANALAQAVVAGVQAATAPQIQPQPAKTFVVPTVKENAPTDDAGESCAAITRSGAPCKNRREPTGEFCRAHS